jgi:hypothetical protein
VREYACIVAILMVTRGTRLERRRVRPKGSECLPLIGVNGVVYGLALNKRIGVKLYGNRVAPASAVRSGNGVTDCCGR